MRPLANRTIGTSFRHGCLGYSEKKPCAWHGSLLIAEGYAAWYWVARLRTISNTPWQASSR